MEKRKEVKWFEKLSTEELDETINDQSLKGKTKSFNKKNFFEQNVRDAHRWIDLVALELPLQDRKDIAWNVLREVMHIIRDRITLEEVLHLSAQLPVIIRGMYFEGYSLSGKPNKFHVEEIEDRIKKVLMGVTKIQPQEAFGAVLMALYANVSEGELSDIRGTLPKDIREYWDESIQNRQPKME